MKKKNKTTLQWVFIPTLMLLIFASVFLLFVMMFVGCSPVKKVLQDPAKLETVGRQWEKQNPCITPTTQVIPGKEVIIRDTVVDTAAIQNLTFQIDALLHMQYHSDTDADAIVKVNSIKKQIEEKLIKNCNPVNIYHTRVDTFVKEDTRRLNIFNDSLNLYRGYRTELKTQVTETKLQVKTEKRRGNKWMIFCLTLAGLTIVKYIVKILHPKLSWL